MTHISKEDILSRMYLKQTDTETNVYAKDDFADTVKSCIYDFALKAMDEYAKEIAIGFAKYAMLNTYQDMNVLDLEGHPDTWSALDYGDQTTEQLFNQYLNTLQP